MAVTTIFPSGLPLAVVGGIGAQFQSNTTDAISGAKIERRRKRGSKKFKTFNVRGRLSSAQAATLIDFYQNDVDYGEDTFLWQYKTPARIYSYQVIFGKFNYNQSTLNAWDFSFELHEQAVLAGGEYDVNTEFGQFGLEISGFAAGFTDVKGFIRG